MCVYVNNRLMSITVFMRKWERAKGTEIGEPSES